MEQQGDGKLLRKWSAWYLIPDRFTTRDANWNEFLHELGEFDSIEDFWAMYNSLEKSALLPKGCRHYIFKSGVPPLWEDRQNSNGFEISVSHPIAKSKRSKITDRFTDVVLSLIGETISNSELINGIEFRVRTEMYMISLWVASSSEEARQQIAKDLEKIVGWQTQATITPIDINRAD